MLGARPRALRGNRGFLTVGAAVAVLAGSLAIAFGAPEHSKLLNLLTGHGWLSTSQPGQVALANGETGQLDFRLNVNSTGDPLDVVQSGQNALLIDGRTGEAGSIDVGNLKVVNDRHLSTGSLGTAGEPDAINQVLPGPGGTFYVVHRRTGRIDVSDPVSGQTVATTQVGAGLSPSVVDGSDSLWTERKSTGAMTSLDYQGGKLQAHEVKSSVVAPGDDVLLSSVNGTPAVLDQSRSLFFLAPRGVPGTAVSLPRTAGRQPIVAPTVQGSVVPLCVGGKVVLIKGEESSVVDLNGRSGDHLGAPVPFAERVYVPDLSDGEVVVLSDSGQQVGTPIKVASGSAPISVDVQNGALFINDPDTPTAYSVASDGQVNRIDKADPNVPTNKATISTPPVTIPTPPPTTIPTPIAPTPGKGAGSGGSGPGSTAPAAPGSTVPASAPAAPGSPSAQAGDQSATVSWTPPATHGSPITGYTVKWSAGGGGSKAVGADKTSIQVSGLKNGTSYTFSITATNAIATGSAATTTSVTPTSTIPDPPSNVIATANKDGSIAVSWTKATGEGHKIASYTVTAKPTSGASLAPVAVTSGTSTTFTTAQGLVLGTSYTFTVTATNDAGGSSKPSTASKAVTSSTTPFAVTNLTASASSRGTVAVSWTCDVSCAGGSPLTEFTVTLTPAVGSPVKVAAAGGPKFSASVTGLADETNYTVSVVALNRAWGAGQVATVAVLTQGQPTATVSPHWTGRSLSLSIGVTPHGASVTGCHVVLTGPGGPLDVSTSGGCHSLNVTVPFFAAAYSGVLIVTSTGFGTTNGANVSTASGLKPMTATALPAFGSCPSPVTGNRIYCGATSSACPNTKWVKGGCAKVPGNTPVEAACWTTGTGINNAYSSAAPGPGTSPTLSSAVWITIPGRGWMNQLYFNPYQSVETYLQHC
ncbi:MAG: fibronectin type III domain-containing protein [Acidimicrobiales bacterium]